MPVIKNTNLSGFTVTYNGVQFGGADSTYPSYPPSYILRKTPHYDETGRAVIWSDFTLEIRCIFYGDTESQMATRMRAIDLALAQPGKQLKIEGMGTGLGLIQRTGGQQIEIANGPKPAPSVWSSYGQATWELSWSVNFSISECTTSSFTFDNLTFSDFSFATIWQNDLEGLTRRTINGHVSIPQARDFNNSKNVIAIAEQTRGNIIVLVPQNFKRVANDWVETPDRQRLNFTIIDEQLHGDTYPPGITKASGSIAFSSGGGAKNISMSQSMTTLSMTLTTAPDQPRNLAGRIFLLAALAKQTELMAIDNNGKATINVIPWNISIVNGKFDDARTTQCSISWMSTKSLSECMAAAQIYEPIHTLLTKAPANQTGQDYTGWKTSMANIWNNRGTSGYGSLPSEAVIIDLCDQVTTRTIGNVSSSISNPTDATLPSLTCPTIPDNGGWIHFDLNIEVYRKDHQSTHRRASTYVPGVGDTYVADPGSGTSGVQLGGTADPRQSTNDQSITEYHGYPEFLIGLSFAGLRYVNKAFMPDIKTVGGQAVRLKEEQGGTPTWAFDVFGCPVWRVEGYRVYSVPGYVPSIKPISSKVATDTSIPLDL